MKGYCALLLFLFWLCPRTMQGQAVPTPLELSNPPFSPEEENPGAVAPVSAPKSGRDFPTFAISYYAPSWFSIASGKGNFSANLEETSPEESLLIPLEFKIAVCQWQRLSLVSSLIPALHAENHHPSSLNLSVGVGIFYNTFLDRTSTVSPLSGSYLMFYPINDISVINGGSKPLYQWKLATDLGYALAVTPAPIPLYLGGYFRWIVGWQNSHPFHSIDFGMTVGMLFL